jgi:hypothetical protein
MNQHNDNQPINGPYESQDDILNNYLETFRKESDEALVNHHNEQSKRGFFGVGRQLL